MKKITFLFFAFMLVALSWQGMAQVVTIGSGTITQRYPLGNYFGFERSASVYTSAEIGATGNISTVAWYANVAGFGSRPIKIYLKKTTSTTQTAATWASKISGATLVYDGSVTPTVGWNTFNLNSPFLYDSDNLEVLVEANYGGGGNTGDTTGNQIRYSTKTNGHEYWYQDNTAPSGSGTVTSNRPNIQLNITSNLPACSGTPVGGVATINPSSGGGTAAPIVVSATGFSTGVSGLTFQWEYRFNAGSWGTVGSAVPSYADLSATIDGSVGDLVELRLKVTCTNSSEISYSTPGTYEIVPTLCIPSSTSSGDRLSVIASSGAVTDILYSASSMPAGGYSDQTGAQALEAYETMNFTINTTYVGGANAVKIWVDWNNDLAFDASEVLAYQWSSSLSKTFSVTVPAGTPEGNYRMRVRGVYSFTSIDPSPCGSVTYGSAVDFTLNIVAPPSDCSGTPDGGIATIDPSSGGGVDAPVLISASGYSSGSFGLTYQWEYRVNSGTWNLLGSETYSYADMQAILNGPVGDIIEVRLKVSCSSSGESAYSTTTSYEIIVVYCNATSSTVEAITRVVFAGIDNTSPASSTIKYEDFTAISGEVTKGETHSFTVEGNTNGPYTNYFTVWIDWNQNGVFDPSEMTQIGSITNSNGIDGQQAINDIIVPSDAISGETRMRVRKNYSTYYTNPCGTNAYGQTEDYTILVSEVVLVDCSGTPEGGIVSLDPEEGSVSSSYTVSVTGYTVGNGLTYQWQSNTDGEGWVNEGTPTVSYSDYIATAPTQLGIEVEWRLEINCTLSSETAYSDIATFTTVLTYCTPVLDCTDGDVITNVTFQEINNSTGCSPLGYGDYTAMQANVQADSTYPISVSVGAGFTYETVSVWIDFDKDGTFNEDEFFLIGTGSGSTVSANIYIPSFVASGEYRMRVRVIAADSEYGTWDAACDEEQLFGETEDYTLNVTGAPISGYVYDNGWLLPLGDPSGVSTFADDITVINGIASLNSNTDANNLTVYAGATLNINYVLNINSDIINDGDVIFVSTSTGNGELGPLSNSSGVYGEGFTVQSYMSNHRAYRMVGSSVFTFGSIHDNWQEGAQSNIDDPNPGFGTHITGTLIDQTNGFDATISGNPSMFTVDIAQQQFEVVPNTDVLTLAPSDGYLLYVRGDRSIDLTNNNASGETVLRSTGILAYGPGLITYPTVNAGDFVMFGNPYPSAVDINSVFGNVETFNVNTGFYYVYDPTQGTFGAYVTVNLPAGTNTGTSQANQYLQMGQGGQFATAGNGISALDFNESDKAPGNFTATSATGNQLSADNMLTVQLFTTENFNNGGPAHDSFGIIFGEGLNNDITLTDAVKPMNFYENLGIDHSGTYLSVERREMPEVQEVYQLYSSGYQYSDYTLKLKIDGLESSFLYLEDNFMGTSTLLEFEENVYDFVVDRNDPLSKATDRFLIRTEQRLGVNAGNFLSGIRLFPNPINGNSFNISAPGLEGQTVFVTVNDMLGREIFTVQPTFSGNIINVDPLQEWSSGVYMVTISFNGESKSLRVIKK